jgi:hypothetical protein
MGPLEDSLGSVPTAPKTDAVLWGHEVSNMDI